MSPAASETTARFWLGRLPQVPVRRLRLRSTFDAPLNFVVGGYFQHTTRDVLIDNKLSDAHYNRALDRYTSFNSLTEGPGDTWSAFGQLIWEIDVFSGENAGLILAEVELPTADHQFQRPTWAGQEVTDDCRYFNASLSLRPFKSWRDRA